jgi:hypothetical protein
MCQIFNKPAASSKTGAFPWDLVKKKYIQFVRNIYSLCLVCFAQRSQGERRRRK